MKTSRLTLPVLLLTMLFMVQDATAQISGQVVDFYMNRYNSATNGDKLPVLDGEILGTIHWRGWTPAGEYQSSTAIRTYVTGNPDLGYLPGRMVFYTGGSDLFTHERMTILENGNVGIGISDPQATLHVGGDFILDGNFTVNGDIIAENVKANNNVEAGVDVIAGNDVNAGNNVTAAGDLSGTNVNATNNVNAGGNVIAAGDVNGENLNANNNVSAGNDIQAGGDLSGTNVNATNNVNAGGNVIAAGDVNGENLNANNDVSAGNNVIATNNIQAGGDLSGNNVNANNDVNAGNNVIAAGDVNGENLHANSDVTAGGNIIADQDLGAGNDVTAINNLNAGNDVVAGNNINALNDVSAGNNLSANNDISAGHDLEAGNDLRAGNDLHVGNNGFFDGQVAIGIPDDNMPDGYRLYVADGILAERIKVALKDSGDWADYVFDEKYNLMPLDEVEAFVKKNKHLPGLPSANEVAQNGIDVARMDAMLLEKIEELTLYLLELKKENDAMRKELDELKSAKN